MSKMSLIRRLKANAPVGSSHHIAKLLNEAAAALEGEEAMRKSLLLKLETIRKICEEEIADAERRGGYSVGAHFARSLLEAIDEISLTKT